MGLFGSSKKEKEEEELKQQEEQHKTAFYERLSFLRDQKGVIVKLQVDGEKKEENYKFINGADTFIFMYNIPPFSSYSQQLYQEFLDHKDILLNKQIYHAELLEEHYEVQPSSEYVAERIYSLHPLTIKFTSPDKPEIIATVTDENEDLSPLNSLGGNLTQKDKNKKIIPEDNFTVKVLNGYYYLAKANYVIFRVSKHLYLIKLSFLKNKMQINLDNHCYVVDIDVRNILFYQSIGSVRYEQQVYGGGGNGINYTGAIVGGLFFGTAGAIIGSREDQEVQPVQSRTVAHDNRMTLLTVREQGKTYEITFSADAASIFDWLIPEKEYCYVISKRREMYEKEDET